MGGGKNQSLSSLATCIADKLGIESTEYIESRLFHLSEWVDIFVEVSNHLFDDFDGLFSFFFLGMLDLILSENWLVGDLGIFSDHLVFIADFVFFQYAIYSREEVLWQYLEHQ